MFKLVRITSKQLVPYRGKVHDLTVQDDHSYVVNKTIVHNSHCSTRIMTGCGVPQLTAVMDVARLHQDTDVPFYTMATGGLRYPGDVAKAIVAGADLVMTGKMFAGTEETPGAAFYDSKTKSYMKMYQGEASLSYKRSHGMDIRNVEGESSLVPYIGPAGNKLEEILQGLRSALSYVGVHTLPELQREGKFVLVSPAAHREGLPHGLGV